MGNDQVLHEPGKIAKGCIIKRSRLGLRGIFSGHGFYPIMVDVVYPDPCCKMWLCRVKKAPHLIPDKWGHIPKPGMIDLVSSSI
jgi:hypothetical protein